MHREQEVVDMAEKILARQANIARQRVVEHATALDVSLSGRERPG